MQHHGAAGLEPNDTTPRALARYLARLRETAPRDRLERALRLSEQVRDATMADIRRQNPGAAEEALAVAFVRRVYGEALARRFSAHRSRAR